ncbi:MAG TPA: 2-dehydropantoate 2-reductase [Steroidobacteraceae bacterium]|nr:2-dehydropantoate 2-reductase [Steroidobacteraceae bacterium]
MREYDFAILGAGAIGSIIGAHLRRAGHDVLLIARGARAAHLEQHGVTIRGLAEFATPVPVLREPRMLQRAGTLIVATKTPGTAAALEPLRSAHFDVTLSIQNGPLKNELLAAAFGAERVLGALADTSGELLPGGEVLFTRNVGIAIGELTGGESARARGVAQALDAAGVRASATPEIQTLEWSKFCGWVGLMPLAVATRAPTWKYLSDPDAALLLVRMVREMGTLARALGIPLSDRAVLPTASLCAAAEGEAVAMVLRLGEEYRRTAPTHRLSALQDVEAGRPLEVHETLGYAATRARELGLDLPLLGTFTRLLAAIDRSRRDASGAV